MNKVLQIALFSLIGTFTVFMTSCENKEQEFVSELKKKKYANALELLTDDFEVNKVDENGTPIIIHAVRTGNLKIVKQLVTLGADVNIEDLQQKTPLTYAILAGKPKTARFLLDKGAKTHLTPQDESYRQVFDAAISKNKIPSLEACLLIADKQTIHKAIFKGFEERKEDIIKATFRFLFVEDEKKAKEFLSIHVYSAIETDAPKMLEVVMDYGLKLTINHLASAVRNEKWEMAKYIISKGVDVNAQNDSGNTLLKEAVKDKKYNTIEKLVSYGADINLGHPIATAIFCEEPDVDFVKKLIKLGADVNYVDDVGENLLMRALLFKDDAETVKLLIDIGVDVNFIDKYNNTVMSAAIRAKRKDCVELLKNAGAKSGYVPSGGEQETHHLFNEMMEAAKNGDTALLETLIAADVPVNERNYYDCTPLMMAAQWERLECVKILVEAGANINAYGRPSIEAEYISTVLACAVGNSHIVKYLIQKGADIHSTKNVCGGTALQIAALHGYHASAQALIDAGADVNERDSLEETPLMKAAEKGHSKTVECLLKAGANRKLKDYKGETALRKAIENNHYSVIELLQAK